MLMLLTVSAVAMIAIAYLGYHSGEVNLTTRIFNQLTSREGLEGLPDPSLF